ncbi:hypothetical protein B0H14DRAFT_2751281, partial [Mycena olivaceomarginata]
LLCFPGQLILQYRIEKILKQRILFKGINDLLNDRNVKIPTRYIRLWDESHASEACLFSLVQFLKTPMAKTRNAAPFIDLLSQVLHLPAKSTPAELALAMKPYLTDTWGWLTMLSALLLGFLMTLVAAMSLSHHHTYIWLGAEAALAAIRLLTWASNPSWDDSDGLWLKVNPRKSKPLQHTLGTDENPPGTFKIIHETRFWEALTAYAGPVNINEMRKIHGFRHWYSWIRRKTAQGSTEMLYIILEGNHTVLCRMREDTQDIEFHRADLTINPGHAMQLETLEEDHELLKWPSEFRISVFEHYNFILSSKGGDCVPIRVSWPLSESSVSGPTDIAIGVPDGGNGSHHPRDGERATPTWSKLQGTVGSTLSGTQLTYTEFSVCFRIISKNATSRGLHRRLSTYLSGYTQSIRTSTGSDRDLAYFYNERWRTYSRGALSLNRLFRPINSNLVKIERQRSEDTVDTVKNMAFAQWNGNVLQALSVRLSVNPAMAIEVERTLASFMSRDLSPYDLRYMHLDISRAVHVVPRQEAAVNVPHPTPDMPHSAPRPHLMSDFRTRPPDVYTEVVAPSTDFEVSSGPPPHLESSGPPRHFQSSPPHLESSGLPPHFQSLGPEQESNNDGYMPDVWGGENPPHLEPSGLPGPPSHFGGPGD